MSKWFRNKETGTVWEVDGELEKRLSSSPNFETVSAPKTVDTDDKENDIEKKLNKLKTMNRALLEEQAAALGLQVFPEWKNAELAKVIEEKIREQHEKTNTGGAGV